MSLRKLKEFCLPDTGEEVVGLLEKYGDGALILAGGTFVHGLDARGLLTEVEALIDIQRLRLGSVDSNAIGLRIGATTTFAALRRVAEVQHAPSLGALADSLECPPVQILNTATAGGCVAAACPFFDVPVALTALDGKVTAQGQRGMREIPLSAFFTGLFENALGSGEFITAVTLPQAAEKSASAFIKLEGNANDLAIVNAAVRVTLNGSGACADARIIVGGGVGDAPVRSAAAERAVVGTRLSQDVMRAAGEAVGGDIEPMSDHRASGQYRKAVAKVLVRRALERAVARLG